MQYLYYLKQIGVAVAPLTENKVYLKYDKNPFPKFFMRGLNVTLATNDPLMCHLTRQPLLEEYSVARQYWNFNAADLSEIARNSVLQSGYTFEKKRRWLGENFIRGDPDSNDIERTNLPRIRYNFRYEAYSEELKLIASALEG